MTTDQLTYVGTKLNSVDEHVKEVHSSVKELRANIIPQISKHAVALTILGAFLMVMIPTVIGWNYLMIKELAKLDKETAVIKRRLDQLEISSDLKLNVNSEVQTWVF